MALGKYFEDIIEARRAKGAQIVFDYQYPQENRNDCLYTDGSRSENRAASSFAMSPEELISVRAFIDQVTRECELRLAGEMTLVFKLNKERTRFWTLGYITKGGAAKVTGVSSGELLDLDPLYRGLNIFNDHLFISERRLVRALQRYGSDVAAADMIHNLATEDKIAA